MKYVLIILAVCYVIGFVATLFDVEISEDNAFRSKAWSYVILFFLWWWVQWKRSSAL